MHDGGLEATPLAVVYFAVPVVFFMIQPRPMRKLTWSQFSLKGLFIRTGHVDGKEAMLQILTLPICLMIAAVAMGRAWTFDH